MQKVDLSQSIGSSSALVQLRCIFFFGGMAMRNCVTSARDWK